MIVISATIILKISHKYSELTSFTLSKKKIRALAISLALVIGIEEVCFAYAKQVGNNDILRAASYTPFSLPVSMTKIFKSIGVAKVKNTHFMPNEKINYPLKKIILEKKSSYPNIVILTAESFRWDLLDPKITPNLCRLAEKSLNFTNHYSGGNRTRMGMFSLFYGLYAPYWYAFEKEKISPVLMNVVQQLNYQIELNTSQSFDYPELRKTLFAGIDEKHMHELQEGPSWKRDEDNIEMIINSIKNRQADRPFFNFMFFESTHAPYNFPENAVVETDYEKDVNYLKISGLGDNIYKIHNRYINAAHHIDAQVGKLLTYLEKEKLMENSIILFTGDHGEEFMEKGRWGHGHNSRFTMYQTRVPFILSVPGETAREINTETNHLQFPAFLLDKLGVTNNYQDYSLTPSLLQKKPDYFLIGNYNYITLQDKLYKITFPFTGQDYFHYNIYHTNNDNFVLKNEERSIIKAYDKKLKKVYAELQRFYQNSQFNTDQDFVIDKAND
ncbi:MAG: sulfatase-like hydrolase/transferase [Lentisphaeraceae bacterium]|nr:sulfatase-like hydrolase/transferase [Lentisphaeraceae bacterium]